jgi:hypothetical protein
LLDADYGLDDIAAAALIGPNAREMSSKLMGPYERQRLQESSVQHERDVAIAASPPKMPVFSCHLHEGQHHDPD